MIRAKYLETLVSTTDTSLASKCNDTSSCRQTKGNLASTVCCWILPFLVKSTYHSLNTRTSLRHDPETIVREETFSKEQTRKIALNALLRLHLHKLRGLRIVVPISRRDAISPSFSSCLVNPGRQISRGELAGAKAV